MKIATDLFDAGDEAFRSHKKPHRKELAPMDFNPNKGRRERRRQNKMRDKEKYYYDDYD